MNATALRILLHYYVFPTDAEEIESGAPTNVSAIHYLTEFELITDAPDHGLTYEITERGRVFVKTILEHPLPEQLWGVPMREQPVHVEEYKGYRIEIRYDDSPQNPRRDYYDPLGTMVCWHRRYNLGDEHKFSEPADFVKSLLTEEENARIERWVDKQYYSRARPLAPEWGSNKAYQEENARINEEACEKEWAIAHSRNLILPLHLYDHGGITISHGSFSCPWDSGQVGWHFVPYTKLREEYSTRAVTKKVLEKAREVLDADLKVYDHYIMGEVYGYVCFDPDGDELDHGSCWGYYEDYDGYPLQEARDAIDYEIEHRRKNHQGRLKTMVRNRVPLERRA